MKRHQQQGFSLVELLVAMLILSFGIVGMMQGLTTALQSNKEAEWESAAAWIASARVEFLRADGYIVAGETEGQFSGDMETFLWRESITETERLGLYDVVVTIHHVGNGKQIYKLETRLFDPPLLDTEGNPVQDQESLDPRSPENRNRATGGVL